MPKNFTLSLPSKILTLIEKLKTTPEVVAIVIGDSYATGKQRPDSDIDIGIYYNNSTKLDVEALKNIATLFNDTPNPLVTECGVWGRWVNGGAS